MDEEVEVERLGFAEQVDARGVRVGKQQHVGFVDRLEAANRRAVEGDPVLKYVGVEERNRNREVLHDARQITEPDVDKFNVFVFDEFEDVVGRRFRHRMLLYLVIRGLTLWSRCCPPVNPMLRRGYVTMPPQQRPVCPGGPIVGPWTARSYLVRCAGAPSHPRVRGARAAARTDDAGITIRTPRCGARACRKGDRDRWRRWDVGWPR